MMSSGKNPLMLMMALSMPGAAHALGLGDIHVDSVLNERFAAEIDIVGATALELADLKAAVANRETFMRFGADRPAFLTSTTFKVTQDSQGRPVLAVRSSESFTEPVVNFLVDLNWRNGQLIRQYTVLLDPAGFAAAPAPAFTPALAAAAAPMAAPPAIAPVPAAEAAPAARKMTHIKIGAKATLRGVAWRAGERSESDLQRMMVAIFRANPTAFDGNINRLHLGALLTIPSRAQAAAIPKAEARREIRAHMAAWRSPTRQTSAVTATVAAAPAAPLPVAADAGTEAPVAKVTDNSPETTAAAALGSRVQSLEQELNQMQGLLQSERGQLLALQRQAALGAQPMAAADAPQTQPKSAGMTVSLIAGLAALSAALVALYLGFRRRLATSKPRSVGSTAGAAPAGATAVADAAVGSMAAVPQQGTHDSPPNLIAAQDPGPDQADTETDVVPALDPDATQPALPALPDVEPARRSEISTNQPPSSTNDDTTINAPHDATVNMSVQTVNLRMDSTRLDYNFLDLDLTAQHVQMPSVLNQGAVVKERRTNLADVLKMAIEREPDRQDLRMKLLELYYSAAATNRKAFLDVVQKLARDRDHLQADQWDKIAFMGRQIAAENPMFAEEADDEDLADCA
jgi:pilus assembly protein FimV